MSAPLLDLDDVVRRLRPSRGAHVGIRPIEIAKIVGTESRSDDFDRDFNPLRPDLRDRLRRLAAAFPASDFAPIFHPCVHTPCASRMPADAFLWLWQQRPALSVEHGPQRLSDVARLAIDGRLRGRRRLWPRGR